MDGNGYSVCGRCSKKFDYLRERFYQMYIENQWGETVIGMMICNTCYEEMKPRYEGKKVNLKKEVLVCTVCKKRTTLLYKYSEELKLCVQCNADYMKMLDQADGD